MKIILIIMSSSCHRGEKIKFDGDEVGDANFDLDFSEDMFADPEPSLHQVSKRKQADKGDIPYALNALRVGLDIWSILGEDKKKK